MTQNELIQIISTKIVQTNMKDAKYYSIIVECTSDVSHKEQMSIIVRMTGRKGILPWVCGCGGNNWL